jgi:hypothetical protein
MCARAAPDRSAIDGSHRRTARTVARPARAVERPALASRLGRGPVAPILAGMLLIAATGAALGQSATYGAVASDRGSGALARLQGVRDGATTVDAWARLGPGVAGGALVRWVETFGPLGNVIFEASLDGAIALADARSPEGVRAAVGVRGVLGPVAAAVRMDGGTVAEDDLDLGLRAELARVALLAAPGPADLGVRGSLTYRPDRATIVTLEPRLRWTPTGSSTWVSADLRRGGFLPELDLWIGAEGGAVGGAGAGALGLGVVWTRRREPDSSLRIWLGADDAGARPGIEAAFAGRGRGSVATLSVALTPHRLDAPPWRLALEATLPAALGGTWRLAAAAAGTPASAVAVTGTRWSLSLGLEQPLRGPG